MNNKKYEIRTKISNKVKGYLEDVVMKDIIDKYKNALNDAETKCNKQQDNVEFLAREVISLQNKLEDYETKLDIERHNSQIVRDFLIGAIITLFILVIVLSVALFVVGF